LFIRTTCVLNIFSRKNELSFAQSQETVMRVYAEELCNLKTFGFIPTS
jgi:hypothetical protein